MKAGEQVKSTTNNHGTIGDKEEGELVFEDTKGGVTEMT